MEDANKESATRSNGTALQGPEQGCRPNSFMAEYSEPLDRSENNNSLISHQTYEPANQRSSWGYLIGVIALFLAAFALPVVFAIKILPLGEASIVGSAESPTQLSANQLLNQTGMQPHGVLTAGEEVGEDSDDDSNGAEEFDRPLEILEQIFPRPFRIGSRSNSQSGRYLRVAHQESLNPQPRNDFLLATWFTLSRAPRDGERVALITKLAHRGREAHGYAVVLVGEGTAVRAQVFWGPPDGVGKWYSFAEVPMLPLGWQMLALSFRQGRYLGLHSVTKTPGDARPAVELLGGYDLTLQSDPIGESDTTDEVLEREKKRAKVDNLNARSGGDLLIGSSNHSRFRGAVGAVALFQTQGLTDSLRDGLKELSRTPLEFPATFRNRDAALWYGFAPEPDGDKGAAVIFDSGEQLEEKTAPSPGGARRSASKKRGAQ